MNYPTGICSWSLRNRPDEITRTLNETRLTRLHLHIDVAREFCDLIEKQGWTVSATMIAFPQENYSTLETIRETGGIVPDRHWPANRELVRSAIEQTAEMNVPYLTFHAGFIDHADEIGYATFLSRCRDLADYALSNEVMLLLETGQETASDLRCFLEDMDHAALGVNFDPANMILYGKGDPLQAVGTLAHWIRHVHIKDAIAAPEPGKWGREVPWGDGQVGSREFIQTLERIGYSGALAIEREAGDTRSHDIKLAIERLEQCDE